MTGKKLTYKMSTLIILKINEETKLILSMYETSPL